jgi:hypothetical protein
VRRDAEAQTVESRSLLQVTGRGAALAVPKVVVVPRPLRSRNAAPAATSPGAAAAKYAPVLEYGDVTPASGVCGEMAWMFEFSDALSPAACNARAADRAHHMASRERYLLSASVGRNGVRHAGHLKAASLVDAGCWVG